MQFTLALNKFITFTAESTMSKGITGSLGRCFSVFAAYSHLKNKRIG